jgi:hypothetical protein
MLLSMLSASAPLGTGCRGDEPRRGTLPAVLRLARRIAAWTWQNVRPRPAKPTVADVAARRAAAGRQTASARRERAQQAILAAALELASAGQPLTRAAILARVAPACNCCDRYRWLRTARLIVEHGAGIPMPELLRFLSTDCPRRLATELERRTT